MSGAATTAATAPKIAATAAAAAVVLVFGVMILGIAGAGGSGKSSSSAKVSCTPGSALRPGSIPNGWENEVMAASQASGVPASILAAQIETESNWDPKAYNAKAGAAGLTQFIPGTWAAYGGGADPYDPIASIQAMGKYMGDLMQQMSSLAQSTGKDVVVLSLAGYNWGPNNVINNNGNIPATNKETSNYIVKIPQLAQTKYSGDCTTVPGPGGGGVTVGPGEWTLPLPGGILTSGFGPRWGVHHAGIDLSTGGGTVVAPTALKITHAGDKGDGYGSSVVGRTTDGTDLQMRFGHCVGGSITVAVDQVVEAGAALCTEGATGNVTGVHLHFEIYAAGAPLNAYASNGHPVDPIPILRSKGIEVVGQ